MGRTAAARPRSWRWVWLVGLVVWCWGGWLVLVGWCWLVGARQLVWGGLRKRERDGAGKRGTAAHCKEALAAGQRQGPGDRYTPGCSSSPSSLSSSSHRSSAVQAGVAGVAGHLEGFCWLHVIPQMRCGCSCCCHHPSAFKRVHGSSSGSRHPQHKVVDSSSRSSRAPRTCHPVALAGLPSLLMDCISCGVSDRCRTCWNLRHSRQLRPCVCARHPAPPCSFAGNVCP